MRLLAISDLHVRFPVNRDAIASLGEHPDDWLIVAGDVCETLNELRETLGVLRSKFPRVFWVPGNHELWSTRDEKHLRGVERYERLVDVCRSLDVETPEDPFVPWPDDPSCFIAPMFLLYDYSFRPTTITREKAIPWAVESGVLCADEAVLSPEPFETRDDWCRARCELTAQRLDALPVASSTVLINHFPLRQEHAVLPMIPRFSIWCGTTRTEDWHRRYRAKAVVSGHLHIRTSRLRDGVRFEEVSLGHPNQWRPERGLESYLREVLPGPDLSPTAAGSSA